jgi:hypothetical protein
MCIHPFKAFDILCHQSAKTVSQSPKLRVSRFAYLPGHDLTDAVVAFAQALAGVIIGGFKPVFDYS